MLHDYKCTWEKAMKLEIDSLAKNGTWVLVSLLRISVCYHVNVYLSKKCHQKFILMKNKPHNDFLSLELIIVVT